MLNYINPEAQEPHKVTVFSKPGCGHCTRAKDALSSAGLKFEEIELGKNGLSLSTLGNVTGKHT